MTIDGNLNFYKFGLEILAFVDNMCNCFKKSFSLVHFIKCYIAWTHWSLVSPLSSSRSTKLTVDMGSSPSLCNASKERAGSTCHSSHPPTATYYPAADDKHDATLTVEEATQYLELSSKPERCRYVGRYQQNLICSVSALSALFDQPCPLGWFSLLGSLLCNCNWLKWHVTLLKM